MKNLIYLLFPFALLSTACEDVIELDVPEGRRRLIVDGLITDGNEVQTVSLKYSSPYFSPEALTPASQALVVVSDDTGKKDTLQETDPGIYQKALQAEVGRSYSLYVKTAQGEEFHSSPQRMAEVGGLDTLFYEFREAGSFNDEEGYIVNLECSDIPEQRKYFRWRLFVNQDFQGQPRNLFSAKDQLADGFKGLSVSFWNHLLQEGDVARVEQMSISEEAYEFLNLLYPQVNSGNGQFGTPPAPIRGNIKGLKDPNEYALGFFMVSAMLSSEIEIRPIEK